MKMDEKKIETLERAVQLVKQVMKDNEVPLEYMYILSGVIIGLDVSMGIEKYLRVSDPFLSDVQLKTVIFEGIDKFVDERL